MVNSFAISLVIDEICRLFCYTTNNAFTMFGSDHGARNVLVIRSDIDPTTNNLCPDNFNHLTNTLYDADVTIIIVGVGTNFNRGSSEITCLVHTVHEQEFASRALNRKLLHVAIETCDFEESDLNLFTYYTGSPILIYVYVLYVIHQEDVMNAYQDILKRK